MWLQKGELIKASVTLLTTLGKNVSFLSLRAVFRKSTGLRDKTGKFSFCPAISLSDICPVNLTNENNIPTTKLPAVLQILILSCIRFQTDSWPASVENISRRL